MPQLLGWNSLQVNKQTKYKEKRTLESLKISNLDILNHWIMES